MRDKTILDNITLQYGDCQNILPELPDNSFDMIFMDPPYGINYNTEKDFAGVHERIFKRKKHITLTPRPILNDSPQEANKLFRKVLPQLARILKPGSLLCCCSGGGEHMSNSMANYMA